ncbi:hypothetical protein FOBRF1_006732 [Fusarium oxysporum]
MTASASQYDVIIVGAGPVGLVLALILKAQGHNILIIERHSAAYGLPRAVGISHQAVEVLNTLGLHDELFKTTIYDCEDMMEDFAIWEGSEGEQLAKIPFNTKLKTGMFELYHFSQPELERILEEACNSRGVEIKRSTTVGHVRDETTHVVVSAESPQGHLELRARFVVGCDGSKSTVRQSAGITFMPHPGVYSRWLIVDVIPKSPEVMATWKDARIVKQYLNWRRTMTSVPAPPYRRRWEIMLLPDESFAESQDPKFIWPLLAEFACTPENADIQRTAVYKVEGGWCEKFHKGRILLAGDAAHVAPPFLAQGLNSGLRDANNLSWRLDFALRYPEKNWQGLFEDYSTEQVGTTQTFVKAAVMLEKLFCVTDESAAKQRDAMIRKGPLPPPDLGILGSPGMYVAEAKGNAGPMLGAGRHFPEDFMRVGNAQQRLYEIVQWGWLLLLDEDASGYQELESTTTMQQFKEVLKGTCMIVGPKYAEDVSGTIREYLRENGISAVLIRPDRYVYGGAKNIGEVERLIRDVFERMESTQVM